MQLQNRSLLILLPVCCEKLTSLLFASVCFHFPLPPIILLKVSPLKLFLCIHTCYFTQYTNTIFFNHSSLIHASLSHQWRQNDITIQQCSHLNPRFPTATLQHQMDFADGIPSGNLHWEIIPQHPMDSISLLRS